MRSHNFYKILLAFFVAIAVLMFAVGIFGLSACKGIQVTKTKEKKVTRELKSVRADSLRR